MNDRFYSCAKALVATVRAGSMSAAATELKTTKSAISQKLALFEAQLGLTLLDRAGRAVKPTAAGLRIFDICAGPVDAALAAEADLGFVKGEVIAGRVSVSGPNSLLGTIFVPMMPELQTRYPDIELELHADDSKSDFAADDIDLAFRTGTPPHGRNISAALPPAERALYTSPALLARFGPALKPDDLTGIPCVLRQQEIPSWSFQDRKGRQRSITPTVGLRVNTMELAHAAARAGIGVAMLPTRLAQSDAQSGALISLLSDWSADPVSVSLLCRAARLAAPPVAAVRRYILDVHGRTR